MRLNRFLALAGLGARRKCETLVWEGRIEVNGATVESPGIDVDPNKDRITCDGERLRPPRVFLYAAMHKPSGLIVSASDERGRATVYDILPERLRGKVRAVGRLDQASEGLLLFTNDGDLANALLHPSRGVERTYMAWVTPPPSPDSLKALRSGVPLGRGQRSGSAQVRVLGTRGSTSEGPRHPPGREESRGSPDVPRGGMPRAGASTDAVRRGRPRSPAPGPVAQSPALRGGRVAALDRERLTRRLREHRRRSRQDRRRRRRKSPGRRTLAKGRARRWPPSSGHLSARGTAPGNDPSDRRQVAHASIPDPGRSVGRDLADRAPESRRRLLPHGPCHGEARRRSPFGPDRVGDDGSGKEHAGPRGQFWTWATPVQAYACWRASSPGRAGTRF